MKLTYRGIQSESTAVSLSTVETGETGRYRGLEIHFRHAEKLPTQPVHELTYRSVPYRTGQGDRVALPAHEPVPHTVNVPTHQPFTPGAVMSTQSISARARAQMISRHQQVVAREQVALDRAAADLGLGHVSSCLSRIQGKLQHDIALACEPSAATMS